MGEDSSPQVPSIPPIARGRTLGTDRPRPVRRRVVTPRLPGWPCRSRWTISNAKAGTPSQSSGNRAEWPLDEQSEATKGPSKTSIIGRVAPYRCFLSVCYGMPHVGLMGRCNALINIRLRLSVLFCSDDCATPLTTPHQPLHSEGRGTFRSSRTGIKAEGGSSPHTEGDGGGSPHIGYVPHH
jgi:hypothetical protein